MAAHRDFQIVFRVNQTKVDLERLTLKLASLTIGQASIDTENPGKIRITGRCRPMERKDFDATSFAGKLMEALPENTVLLEASPLESTDEA